MLFKKVKESRGFISLEFIATTVIIIALVVFIMLNFRDVSDHGSRESTESIYRALNDINESARKTAAERNFN